MLCYCMSIRDQQFKYICPKPFLRKCWTESDISGWWPFIPSYLSLNHLPSLYFRYHPAVLSYNLPLISLPPLSSTKSFSLLQLAFYSLYTFCLIPLHFLLICLPFLTPLSLIRSVVSLPLTSQDAQSTGFSSRTNTDRAPNQNAFSHFLLFFPFSFSFSFRAFAFRFICPP